MLNYCSFAMFCLDIFVDVERCWKAENRFAASKYDTHRHTHTLQRSCNLLWDSSAPQALLLELKTWLCVFCDTFYNFCGFNLNRKWQRGPSSDFPQMVSPEVRKASCVSAAGNWVQRLQSGLHWNIISTTIRIKQSRPFMTWKQSSCKSGW